jgi:Coenzyme PQQ synthesis protein D (PqqD)
VPQVTAESVLVRKDRVLGKSSGGSLVLLDIDSGEYFSTNDVGGLIWDLADGSRSVSAIVGAVAAEYDVELDVVETDVMELVAELVDASLLLPQRR